MTQPGGPAKTAPARALPETVAAVVGVLRFAAQAGTPCPTNGQIAVRLACKPATAAWAVARAAALGVVRVETAGPVRRIGVDGCWTGWTLRAEPANATAPALPRGGAGELWQPSAAYAPCLSRGDATARLDRPPFADCPGDRMDLDGLWSWAAAARPGAVTVYAAGGLGTRSRVGSLARRLALAGFAVLAQRRPPGDGPPESRPLLYTAQRTRMVWGRGLSLGGTIINGKER